MAEETLSTRLVEIESLLDRSRRRVDEGARLVEEAHKALADIHLARFGSPGRLSPPYSDVGGWRVLASI
jgi:hypothetical protein